VFNIGGGEVLVIMLLALIVLGPQRLPDAAKQIGRVMGELRRMSSGFQQELRSALDDPLEAAARERGAAIRPAAPAAEPVKRVAATKPAAAKKTAGATTAAPRKRATPLRAAAKPDQSPAS